MKNDNGLDALLLLLDVPEEKRDGYQEKFLCVDEYVEKQNLECFHDKVILSTGLTCTLFMLLEAGICPGDPTALMKDAHKEWDEQRKKDPGLDDREFFYNYFIRTLAKQN